MNSARPSRNQDTPGVYGWLNMNAKERRRLAAQYARQKNRVALIQLYQAHAHTKPIQTRTKTNHTTRLRSMLFEAQQMDVRLYPPRQGEGEQLLIAVARYSPMTAHTLRLHGASLRALYDALSWAGLKPHDPFEHRQLTPLCQEILQKTRSQRP